MRGVEQAGYLPPDAKRHRDLLWRTAANGGLHEPRDRGPSYTVTPSRSAAWSTVPITVPRRLISSGVVTTISLLNGRSPRARLISTAARRLSGTSRITTRRSTSLDPSAVPRACDPKRTTRDGWNLPTMRSTIVAIFAFEVIVPFCPLLNQFEVIGATP